MRTGFPAIIGLAGAVAFAGCGGGGGSSTSGTSSTSSSADFVAEGNKICKEDNAKFTALGQPQGSDLRPFLKKLAPLEDKDLARLKGLTPPSDQEAVYTAWISLLSKGTALTKEAANASSAGAVAKILQPSRSIDAQADVKAKQLALAQCLTGAGGGSSSG